MSDKGRPYGSEYATLLKDGNIKFVQYNDSGSAKAPMETMTRGRIYATVNADGNINSITTYDENGKRNRSINLLHSHREVKGNHTHIGYEHYEGGTRKPNKREQILIDFVLRVWQNRKGK